MDTTPKMVGLLIRTKRIIDWIIANQQLFSLTDAVKITLNIKGESVMGEVTSYPDRKNIH